MVVHEEIFVSWLTELKKIRTDNHYKTIYKSVRIGYSSVSVCTCNWRAKAPSGYEPVMQKNGNGSVISRIFNTNVYVSVDNDKIPLAEYNTDIMAH